MHKVGTCWQVSGAVAHPSTPQATKNPSFPGLKLKIIAGTRLYSRAQSVGDCMALVSLKGLLLVRAGRGVPMQISPSPRLGSWAAPTSLNKAFQVLSGQYWTMGNEQILYVNTYLCTPYGVRPKSLAFGAKIGRREGAVEGGTRRRTEKGEAHPSRIDVLV
jgi:hypothetical protein